ncbi:hypothetical protein U9M48_004176 [Paspalum notatum var. saurae]|uniref:Disease resistance protein RPM1 n=1 Tax=Paspalum notatum var. saurae TaxID=547442 RepID=A0AAQ3PSR6_PASNO
MADLAVSLAKTVVEGAVTRALSAIEEEAALRESTQNDLVSITGEFQMMQSFLNVADEERVSNGVVRTWVRQVRDLAYNVEDGIEYVIHLDKTPDWYCRCLPSFLRPPDLPLNKAVAEIKQLKARVEEVSLRNMRYNLISDSGSKPAAQPPQLVIPGGGGGSVVEAATYEMVFQARDTTKMKRAGLGDLTKLLVTKKHGDDLGVISLWAAGGNLDTTPIIREAYGEPEICASFGCRGWAKLTHPFNPQEFQRSLLIQFQTNSCLQNVPSGGDADVLQRSRSDILRRLETAAQGELVQKFVEKMEQERYLVVLENVSSMMDWDTVRAYLPDGKNGSWIIVSTQQPQIARLCVGDPCHALELKQHSVQHSVCVFFREVSQGGVGGNGTSPVDKDRHNNGYALYANIPTSKTNANKWIDRFPLVGVRMAQMEDLRSYLTKACVNGFPVISVWGIAGVGKSALVRNLYYNIMHDKGNKTFPKLSWVDVLHPFNLTNIAWSLLSEFESNPPQQDGTTNSPQPDGTNNTNQDGSNNSPQQDGTSNSPQDAINNSPQRDGTKYSSQQDRISNPIHVCRQFMDQDRCLVVIDGLQTTEEWDLIRHSLVSKCSKSIIVVITTDATVAMHCANQEEAMYNVKSLEDNEAYDLFSTEVGKLAELSPLKDCKDTELRTLISKCGGLPKVIVAIADFLAPMTVSWMNSAVNMSNTFMHDLKTKAEFDDLRGLFGWMDSYFRNCPDYLKPCILYLSIFPQGQSIRRRRLVRRWIAEGYCRDTYDGSAEENGEKFFLMLLDLSIIQQTPESVVTTADTRMILCQVNNFFREYIISRRKDEDLVFELEGRCILNTQRTGRHLVLKESWDRDKIVFDSIDFSRLRSLTVFGKWKPFFISKNMAVLRVLDLENASGVTYEYLEKMLRLLPRLKFLSLRGLKDICHLPSSFVVLRQLQTLDVRGTSIVTLPPSITKLSKLQYIRAGTTVKELLPIPCAHLTWLPFPRRACPVGGVEVPPGIEKLTALHTLGVVNVTLSGGMPILKELKKLTQLHKLSVTGVSQKNSKEFWSAISEHVHLESLSVWLSTGSEHCLDDMSLPQQKAAEDKAKKKTQHKAQQMYQERHLENLRSLKLYGLAGEVPSWIKYLPKLKKLDLDMTISGKADISKALGEMEELLILRLHVNLRQGADITLSQEGEPYVELGFHVMMYKVQKRCYLNVKILEIALKSDLNVPLKVSFGSEAMQSLELLTASCSSEFAILKFCDLKNLSEKKLKEVRYLGSLDDTLKEDMENQLREHPRKPSLKLE